MNGSETSGRKRALTEQQRVEQAVEERGVRGAGQRARGVVREQEGHGARQRRRVPRRQLGAPAAPRALRAARHRRRQHCARPTVSTAHITLFFTPTNTAPRLMEYGVSILNYIVAFLWGRSPPHFPILSHVLILCYPNDILVYNYLKADHRPVFKSLLKKIIKCLCVSFLYICFLLLHNVLIHRKASDASKIIHKLRKNSLLHLQPQPSSYTGTSRFGWDEGFLYNGFGSRSA